MMIAGRTRVVRRFPNHILDLSDVPTSAMMLFSKYPHATKWRFFSNSSNSNTGNVGGDVEPPPDVAVDTKRRYKYIPEPTWSIQDLDLFSNHPPLPQEELERLSRLALIDISRGSKDEQARLNQDLANMLHMIQQVTDYYNNDDDSDSPVSRALHPDDDPTCSSEIYDFVRGVSAAPLRKGVDEDPLQHDDAKQAREVWDNLLQPKTIRKGGGHQYFAIVTEEAKSTK